MKLSISCKKVEVKYDDDKLVDVSLSDVQDSDEQMEHIIDWLGENYGEKALDYFNRIYENDQIMTEIKFDDTGAVIVFPRVHLVPKQEALDLFKEIKALDKKPCDDSILNAQLAPRCNDCPLWTLAEKTNMQSPCGELFKVIKEMEF